MNGATTESRAHRTCLHREAGLGRETARAPLVEPVHGRPLAVFAHLSGERRGSIERLEADDLTLRADDETGVRALPAVAAPSDGTSARLHRLGATYELVALPGRAVWHNGKRVRRRATLLSGDVVELGGGPLLRYRLYPSGDPPRRTLAEAFTDCVHCLRHEHTPLPMRLSAFLGGMCEELAARTTLWFRAGVALTLGVLAASTLVLSAHNARLEHRLAEGEERVSDISRKIAHTEERLPTRDELGALREEVVDRFSVTLRRIEALEERNRAAKRIIAAASRSVVFLQGAYGFEHEETGQPLRYLMAPNGEPFQTRRGGLAVSPDGDGPPVEVKFTGTAFVVGTRGHLVTNRHVAIPWEDNNSLERFATMGYAPVMRRFVGFLPDETESFNVHIAAADEDGDVAVLKASLPPGRVSHLEIASRQPRPGDDVIVMGYPTGIRALVARAGESFLEELEHEGELDFWLVTRKLSEAGAISPLASRGIVGQVSEAAVVYDAETARGGSGGPVLDLDGKVVAINSAILPEFGGSNIGVPIRRTLGLLARAAESEEALVRR